MVGRLSDGAANRGRRLSAKVKKLRWVESGAASSVTAYVPRGGHPKRRLTNSIRRSKRLPANRSEL